MLLIWKEGLSKKWAQAKGFYMILFISLILGVIINLFGYAPMKLLVYSQVLNGFLMPLTPNPGTAAAQRARDGGYLAGGDLACYNFHTPVCRTDSLGLRELESVYWRIMLNPSRRRLGRAARQLLFERDRRKRRVSLALLSRGTTIAAKSLLRAVLKPGNGQPTLYSRKPSWYDH